MNAWITFFLNKFLQRKFWVALAGGVAFFVGDTLGMPEEAVIIGGMIMAVWVVVEGALDLYAMKTQNAQLRQLLGQMQANAAESERLRVAAAKAAAK